MKAAQEQAANQPGKVTRKKGVNKPDPGLDDLLNAGLVNGKKKK